MYPNRPGLERRWAALALLLLAPTAWAHDADIIYATLTEQPGGSLEEKVTLTASTLSQLAPIDADKDGALSQADLDARSSAIAAGVWEQIPLEAAAPCLRSAEHAVLREGFVELSAHFVCPPGPLSQDFRILRTLTSNYRVVLGSQLDGQTGQVFAQGNVQRLLLRAAPASADAVTSGFAAGALTPWVAFDVTLLFLLSLLLAGSVGAVAERWLVLTLSLAVVSLTLGALELRVPEIVGEAIVATVGVAFAFLVLARDRAQAPLIALGLLAIGESLRESTGGSLPFQAGRAVGLGLVAGVGAPILRMIARRPGLKREATVALACASLAAVGFSLVQTLRTF